MKEKEYYVLTEELPWFPMGIVLERRGVNGDGTRNWSTYNKYTDEDSPQRYVLNFYFERRPEIFKRIVIEELNSKSK